MSTSWTAVGLLALGLLLANLPFLAWRGRGLRWQLLGLVMGYALFLLAGGWAEGRLGPRWPQGWAFYVITAKGFVVGAFPGFVYAWLWRRPR
ncbi:MAG: hypothetical protein GAK30_01416 [Paracidovorax wautersii]|uniref:Transmembrane protein n=1 Tax=Paracidovorax wautersii TaxID=1177982 RepID=A0A7V8FQ02_9BURK|nr:MAG: hypothetical protein GAK30_01416 [Paracidovorax wautersii]